MTVELDEWGMPINSKKQRKRKSNTEKIKRIIDKQVDALLDKSIQGKALSNMELQSLSTCITILKMGFEELDKKVGKIQDVKELSTAQLKKALKSVNEEPDA